MNVVKPFIFSLVFSTAAFANVEEGYTGKPAPLVAAERPEQIQGVGIDEKLGTQLDGSLQFKDENGQTVLLSQFLNRGVPLIVSPVYFSCPGLCNFHLNGLTESLRDLPLQPGKDFEVLAISFDAKENSELAKAKKETYMKMYNRPGKENGWHFLTTDQANIDKFTNSVGFKFKWDAERKEWAHASSAILVSPKGILTRYLPGITFQTQDLRLGILEAGQGTVGTFLDQLVLYCFRYNPHQSKYTLYAFNLVKIGGIVMVIILASMIFPVWRRSRKTRQV